MHGKLLLAVIALFAFVGLVSTPRDAGAQSGVHGSASGDELRLAQRNTYDPYSGRRYRYNNYDHGYRPYRYRRRPVRRPRPRHEPAPVLWKTSKGNEDPTQLIVSLPDQTISVYKGTELITTSRVSTGRPGYSTPAGVFSILQKNRHHYSNLYGGAAMPYMQRLTWSGVALHASNSVPRHAASHGCVRLPPSFARKLFPFTQVGAQVIIANQNVTPREFSHPTLFQPMPPPPPIDPVAQADPQTTQSSGEGEPSQEPGWLDWLLGGSAEAGGEMKVAEAITPTAQNVMDPAQPAAPPAVHAKPRIVYGAGAETPSNSIDKASSDNRKPAKAAKPLDTVASKAPSASPIRILITRRTGRARMLEIQKLLFDLGHEPGAIDGFMGRDTATAIRRFQAFEGLPPTGLMNDDLLPQLHEAAGMDAVKEGHIYLRRDYVDLFDAPLMIADSSKPLGTHHFTVMHFEEGAQHARWLALSLKDRSKVAKGRRRSDRNRQRTPEAAMPDAAMTAGAKTLDRIEIPDDIRIKISSLLRPGSSLSISDHGLGPETGKGTDFIVLTH